MTTPLPIQPRPKIRGGLDSVVVPLPVGEDEWRRGVSITGEIDADLHAWDATGCVEEGYTVDDPDPIDEKPATAPGYDSGMFYPTMIPRHVECNIGGAHTSVGDIITGLARSSFERTQYRTLARILHGRLQVMDGAGTPNPSMSGGWTGDQPIYPDGFDPENPGSIMGTIQGLLDIVCSCSNSDPVFHIPRAFMHYFLVNGLVQWDEAAAAFRMGPHLVSFDCYPNLGSDVLEQATPTADDGTEVWIWATQRPMVALGAVDEVTITERRQNKYNALVERPAIIAFDTICRTAAKARVCA